MNWTPCYERLPEDDGEYLVTCSYVVHDVLRNIDHVVSYVDIRWFDSGSGWSDETVVAWMPLPAAWEDDTENGTIKTL